MNSKDRYEDMTKEGCGRVILYKSFNIAHSYTLELGFHSTLFLNELPHASNTHRKIQ